MDCVHQAPLPMEFSRQEYRNGLPVPYPGHPPDPWIEPRSPALQADSLLFELPGKPLYKVSPHFLAYIKKCKLLSVKKKINIMWGKGNEVFTCTPEYLQADPIISEGTISNYILVLFCSSVQSLSLIRLFATSGMAAHQASLSITNSQSPPNAIPIESVMPSSHLILCYPFFSCPQSLPASGSFPMSQLFAWGGQSTGVSASTSALPMNTQDSSPLGWTGCISLQSKGLSRVFSNTTVQKHQFFSTQLSSQSNSHIHTWPLEKP